MNSHKTTIIVLVVLLVCSSFTIGYLIDKNFYIKVVNNKLPTTIINLGDTSLTEIGTTTLQTMQLNHPTDLTPERYEVKKGDTLDVIARLFGISKKTIIQTNNLKTEKISAGDVLLIDASNEINNLITITKNQEEEYQKVIEQRKLEAEAIRKQLDKATTTR